MENEIETMKMQIKELLKLKELLTKGENQTNIAEVFKFKCDVCGKGFTNRNTKWGHLKQVHNKTNLSDIVDVNEEHEMQPLSMMQKDFGYKPENQGVERKIKEEPPEILIENACSGGTVIINDNHLNTFGKN